MRKSSPGSVPLQAPEPFAIFDWDQSLFGLGSGADDKASRDHLRRSNGGGGGRWPGSGGPGGPGRNDLVKEICFLRYYPYIDWEEQGVAQDLRNHLAGMVEFKKAKCLGSAQTDSGMGCGFADFSLICFQMCLIGLGFPTVHCHASSLWAVLRDAFTLNHYDACSLMLRFRNGSLTFLSTIPATIAFLER
ncbi:unnamed protein product [Haemonchus placei]|uniref:Cysteine protease n=1 Tax=Haemonchus placei TaxID=6290 RepID=A0A0N4WRH1_HAEPC|nr:unnamed protein product [Haemonchus placei]